MDTRNNLRGDYNNTQMPCYRASFSEILDDIQKISNKPVNRILRKRSRTSKREIEAHLLSEMENEPEMSAVLSLASFIECVFDK